jgi:hypothetical protein
METNKPVLTKGQAEAMKSIEDMLSLGDTVGVWASKSRLVSYKLSGMLFVESRKEANSISDDDFIKALYIGYDVEKTPEDDFAEKVRAHRRIVNRLDKFDTASFSKGFVEGAKEALAIANKTIKGVNA